MDGSTTQWHAMPAAGQLWPPPVSDLALAELERAVPSGLDEDNEILLVAVAVTPPRHVATDAA